ncbi:hypothetical protein [Sphingomonas sp. CFBP 8765]|uniref:hypothetical protein n=1 Tax=Sphingomonas sp. CFBP 8765 TaxID=2775274 RepID=UPI00177E5B25|nr:hypothetical protein [Sphingomonas sp. CFBP 8765]MBD8471537.1 hypothetical protein [Sphingomonas sp. CFBP 8765]
MTFTHRIVMLSITMRIQRTASLLALAATFLAFFGGDVNAATVIGTLTAIVAIGVNWWLAELQNSKNTALLRHVAQLEKRSETEKATAAAFYGQGQLATWNYDQLVARLRADGLVV